MKVLAIGGSGQTGHRLCEILRQKDIEFLAPSRSELDIANAQALHDILNEFQPSMVVNCAGYRSLSRAEQEPSRCFAINRDAVAALADLCHAMGMILIHLSSYLVFDGCKSDPYTEEDEPNPQGVLACSIWQGEQQIRDRCPRHIILRVGWVISARRENMVNRTLTALRLHKPITVASDKLGNPTPAENVAKVFMTILYQLDCDAQVFGTYHYAGVEAVSESKFNEVIYNEASQFEDLPINCINVVETEQLERLRARRNDRLANRKILRTFGIHAKPWRTGLVRIMKKLYEQNN
ncbi:SDR family oxidoreductase [Zooshikella sp. RANM57]|uniref:SDR family oxidoreductase n=1 Tax=Zooshikella sp. RANM57 TaxID=3425863 RepID=UPI003D6E88C2